MNDGKNKPGVSAMFIHPPKAFNLNLKLKIKRTHP